MKARTVCCRVLTDVEKGVKARVIGHEYLVCNIGCQMFLEKATPEQLEGLLSIT